MQEHFLAIAKYAEAYAVLEALQRRQNPLLPIGDQKTGVIGEFYARLYAEKCYQGAQLEYGKPSEHAWDITVRHAGREDHKIQVKAVSAHSETSRVSNIHSGWDELYLLRLDEALWPIGFWTLRAQLTDWSGSRLGGSTMPKRGTRGSGSAAFSNAVDRLEELLAVLNHARAG